MNIFTDETLEDTGMNLFLQVLSVCYLIRQLT